MATQKAYGLIIPKKKAAAAAQIAKPLLKTSAIFGGDSDSDEDQPGSSKPKVSGVNVAIKKQDRMAQKRAEAEDPTVYQYDEVYEDIKTTGKSQAAATQAEKAEEGGQKKPVERKSKYIGHLLKHAEYRQKDFENRIERQQRLERQLEGEQFADKEVFVTSAYRKKMEELEKFDLEQRQKDRVDQMMDVTKQKNMSGFYRHMLNDEVKEEEAVAVKEEPQEEVVEEAVPIVEVKTEVVGGKQSKKRAYRRQAEEESESEEEKDVPEERQDSSSSEDDSSAEDMEDLGEVNGELKVKQENGVVSRQESTASQPDVVEPTERKPETAEERKARIRTFFARRNTDESIDAYRRRYFERKAQVVA